MLDLADYIIHELIVKIIPLFQCSFVIKLNLLALKCLNSYTLKLVIRLPNTDTVYTTYLSRQFPVLVSGTKVWRGRVDIPRKLAFVLK